MAQIVVVDDKTQLEKINQIKDNLPELIEIIETSEFSELMKTPISDDIETEYQRRLKEIFPNQCCTVVYTSGTTGFPKGAMMSHDNLIWEAITAAKCLGCFKISKEVFISYLPLSHLAAFVCDIVVTIHTAGAVYFTDSSALKGSLLQYLKEVQPTVIFSVPRMYEKIEEKFKEKASNMGFLKRKLFMWAQSVLLEYHQTIQSNAVYTATYKLAIAKKLITDPIKNAIGFSRCKLFLTGSAPTGVETKNFFMGLDMPLLDAYGMTESSTIHTVQSQGCRSGSVGKQIIGVETKILNKNEVGEGEICMKGRHVFMGYLNDREKTRETIDDEGWLQSGDIGYLDDEGFLFMKGRIKELIITSGGENIPVPLIENTVKASCPAISNAFLVGDKRKYLTMLLTIKTQLSEDGSPTDELAPEALSWLTSKNINYISLKALLDDNEKLYQVFHEVVEKVNINAISNAQKIQKFTILPHDFSMATGELTPTLKIKRNVVVEKYKETIEELY